jgi:hypothetical protein
MEKQIVNINRIAHNPLSGQVEAIQSILKYPIYDPMIQYWRCRTALHLLLDMKNFKEDVERFQRTTLFHVLPNSKPYKCIKMALISFRMIRMW